MFQIFFLKKNLFFLHNTINNNFIILESMIKYIFPETYFPERQLPCYQIS